MVTSTKRPILLLFDVQFFNLAGSISGKTASFLVHIGRWATGLPRSSGSQPALRKLGCQKLFPPRDGSGTKASDESG